MMLFLAEDDLVIKDQIHLENGLAVVIAVCLLLAVVLVALVVWLARPSRKPAKIVNRGRHDALAGKTVWHQRIDDVVSRHAQGELEHCHRNGRAQPDAHRHRRDASDHGEPAGSHLAQANHRGIVSAGIRGCRAQSHRQAGHGRAGWRMGGQSCGKVAIDATVMALALGLSGRRHRGAGRCRRHVAGGRAPQNR